MRDEDNPYRPPEARIASVPLADDTGEVNCWRDGSTLVVLRGRPLPPRCVKCNADARDGMRECGFVWITPWSYAPLLVLLLVPLISARWSLMFLICVLLAFLCSLSARLFLRKRARHAVGLCATHRRWRRQAGFSAILLMCVGLVSPFIVDSLAPMLVMVSFSVAIAWSGGRPLSPTRIDDRYAYYTECGEAFLRSLPMLPEYRTHYRKRRAPRR